ncbi:family 43 glycosylhydrolase [Pelagicoccus sp. NFK12]|uniref:Family 43 glycosylhydrolase n=1 Tax=Pelagicoccus enzymogenes TaxID=2773457 RepID=A0A927F8X9_9BACT|nr:family 43 glycosylhydrolase [Pelagicoccus enzymogenes]MBD5780662.1 family 43 glycosylhydrolase [Pelagicoccus enzymogenes]
MRSPLLLVIVSLFVQLATAEALKLEDIRVRDSFIVADEDTGLYYLYAQKANRLTRKDESNQGVEAYVSKDLVNWSQPYSVLTLPDDFWGRQMIWAPEVHKYQGNYYLFVTFTSHDTLRPAEPGGPPQWKRGTQILRSENGPLGPFEPISADSQTPPEQMCLDGSLWVEDGTPYLIYCHEWAETEDGTIDYAPLTDDLSELAGEPKTLFTAKSVPWAKSMKELGHKYHGYVTDGNFIYRTKAGELIMIWSTFGPEGYALIQARSDTGKLAGPWTQIEKPLFAKDGGHGMIFKTFEGQLVIALHQPNGGQQERARLFKLDDQGDRLALAGSFKPSVTAGDIPDGWYVAIGDQGRVEQQEIFSHQDGVIHVYPTQAHNSEQPYAGLVTENEYSRYRLSLEYKWGEKKFIPRHDFVRDAGICFHLHGEVKMWPDSVECQIQEGDTGDLWVIGSQATSTVQNVIRNYSPKGTEVTRGGLKPRFARFHRSYCWEVHGWNEVVLEVNGDHAKFFVNGSLVNEAKDMKRFDETKQEWVPLTSGPILLQAEGAELYYRNITIEELN